MRERESLEEQLAALPAEIDPPRDLLPEILERLPAAGAPRRSRWLLAAAVVAAVGVAFVAGRWSGNDPGPAVTSAAASSASPEALPTVSPASTLAAASASLVTTRLELRRAFESSRADLPPDTRALVEANLATIEHAMAEIEAAIASNPSDPELGRMLVAYQTREIALLKKAHRAATRL